MGLYEALFIAQLFIFLGGFFYNVNCLINFKQEEENFTWSTVFITASIVTVAYGLGLVINLFMLDTFISTIFYFQNMIYMFYIGIIFVSIFMMFSKIPTGVKPYRPKNK